MLAMRFDWERKGSSTAFVSISTQFFLLVVSGKEIKFLSTLNIAYPVEF